jgi:hypothetical protein
MKERVAYSSGSAHHQGWISAAICRAMDYSIIRTKCVQRYKSCHMERSVDAATDPAARWRPAMTAFI